MYEKPLLYAQVSLHVLKDCQVMLNIFEFSKVKETAEYWMAHSNKFS